MKRAVMLMLVALTCIAATARTNAAPSKYVRAIIVYGNADEGQQVMAEFEDATAFYGRFILLMLKGEQYSGRIKSRPCLNIAVIMLNASNSELPAEQLHPGSALFTYWYYPALNGEPALTQSGRIMKSELVEMLPQYKEEFLKRTDHTPCPRVR